MHLTVTAAHLGPEDWVVIEQAYPAGSIYLPIFRTLRENGNKPMKACDLYPSKYVNRGEGAISTPLRLAKLPYRLMRIGTWAGVERRERLVAVVRLSADQLNALEEHFDARKKKKPRP